MSERTTKLQNNYGLLVLFFIFGLGFLLRFYNLGGVPVGFHRDEAFLGYNAFSILLTGKDMNGNVFPLHLESFLYSPAGYSYFSIPFIFLFGLSEFSVRFASALFGSLTVVLIYFLVKELFKIKSEYQISSLAIIASLLLAISPWHINLSRVATENVIVVFFLILGILLYLKWREQQRKIFLIFCVVSFGVTLFLYQAPRAFLPIFLPFLFFIFPPKQLKKNILLPLLLFLICVILPVFLILSSHDLSQRVRMLSILQHPYTQLALDEQIREDGSISQNIFIQHPLITRIFHNKVINYSSTFLDNYFNHFSYTFLFTDAGLPDRYRVPDMGLLYLFELPLLLFGIWRLFMLHRRVTVFLAGWVIIAPIGSALTFDDIPNLQRTLLMIPALAVIAGFGLLEFWKFFGHMKYGYLVKGLALIIFTYGSMYYIHQYYVHQINHRPWFRQEGFRELVTKVNEIEQDYKKVVITNHESDPAIFFLFYNRYDPSLVQQKTIKHFDEVTLGKYIFIREGCPLSEKRQNHSGDKMTWELKGERTVLYINHGTCKISSNRVKTLAEIRRNDDFVVFKLQEVQ